MASQDVITFRQEKIIFIHDEKQIKLFEDENLSLVLKFLRKGPMTINDFITAFEKHGETKSDKSIYRYLQKLINAKLIAKAGKRISSSDTNELISETLFMRTAKAFIIKESLKKHDTKAKPKSLFFDAMFLFLKKLYGDKKGDFNKLKDLIIKIDNARDQFTLDLFMKADEETNEKVDQLEGHDILYSLDYATWLAILEKFDLKKELDSIFSN